MTLLQARNSATIKKIVGWIIFLLSTLSTAISLLNYLSTQHEKLAGVNAVLSDFLRVMIDMIRFNTSFLNLFWHHSPVPDFSANTNVMFGCFYPDLFGMALNAAGSRQWRQYRYVKEQLEDQHVVDQALGHSPAEQRNARSVSLPGQSVFRQYYLLYVLPIIVILIGYLLLHWLTLV